MHKKLQLDGLVSGRLTVVQRACVIAKNTFWICQCSCDGLYSIIRGKSITGKRIQSCGCIRREMNKKKAARLAILNTLAPGEAALNQLYASYEWHAVMDRSLTFNLTVDEFRALTKGNCFYCGVEPKQVSRNVSCKGSYTYNGIDRKDSSLGYSPENCVSCCGSCNKAKGKKSVEDFLVMCRKVSEKAMSGAALETAPSMGCLNNNVS